MSGVHPQRITRSGSRPRTMNPATIRPMTDRRWIASTEVVGVRLDKFLADPARLGSRSQAARALERGKVFLNDVEAGPDAAARRLAAGDRVRVWVDCPGSARRRTGRTPGEGELSIVFEDEALVVVNKPAGLLAVPLPGREAAPSVEDVLLARLRARGKRRPLVVHRIDRDTSGLVAFAFRPEAHAHLKEQFRRHEALSVLPRDRLRPSVTRGGHLGGHADLGRRGDDSEGDPSADPRGKDGHLPVCGAAEVSRDLAD